MTVPAFNAFTRRTVVWLAIAAAHAALIVLIGSLAPRDRTIEELAPLDVRLLPEPHVMSQRVAIPVELLSVPVPLVDPPVFEMPEEAAGAQVIPTPVAAAETVARIEPARFVSDVAYIRPPEPHYPSESRRRGEEGLVLLEVAIDELGRVVRVKIERSSGHARLDAAARAAVLNAKFRPYVENGIALAVLATIPIEFNWKRRGARYRSSLETRYTG